MFTSDHSVSPVLAWAHPIVQEWFDGRFGQPTEPQELGWPHIVSGRATLISAPTGSGKTLAAFLACIDRLVRKAAVGELTDRTEVLYVSPLKALSNDVQKNLEAPLGEILRLAAERGYLLAPIRTAVRTGDTLMHERRAMLEHPPHILVTTPESLYILLTSRKGREMLQDVETVIVDEIHAVADDKRGAHLALSLERLQALITAAGHPAPVRIGLSATQRPLERIARFLTGADRPEPAMVQLGHARPLDLAVEVPRSELGAVATHEMWDEVYDRLAELALEHRSTLIFVNTRSLAERVSHRLAERLGPEAVAAHHGSLSRKIRLAAESKLKAGELRALVATASLELGIDIGTVDLVCQINSPRSIAATLQRIGRAGHWRGAVPKGRLFPLTRDDLIECAALVRAIRQGDLDEIQIPAAPMDILAQQIVAMCAAEDWQEEELLAIIRRADPYRNVSYVEFDALLDMLADGISARRGRYGAYLYRDRVNHRLRGRRGSRLVAITNGGAIPENALYTVVLQPEGTTVGTVDEDFAVESNRGDIVLLGNTSWRIQRVESASGRMLVEDAHGAAPTIPFWRGEAPARTEELSRQVSDLREMIGRLAPGPAVVAGPSSISQSPGRDSGAEDQGHVKISQLEALYENRGKTADLKTAGLRYLPAQNLGGGDTAATTPEADTGATARDWLKRECGLDASGAEQAVEYVLAGRAALGAIPSQTTLVAERFFDEAGGMQLIIHAPLGGRINKAWGLALRKKFCRNFNFELQASATENGLNISLGEQHSFPLADVFQFLSPQSVGKALEQASLASPIFATRWRWDATRALALTRFRNGKKIPLYIQRMRADDLLAAVFPDAAACRDNIMGDIALPDHPLVREVVKDVFTEAMDLEGLTRVLQGIVDGGIRCLAVDTTAPSVFSHEILNSNPYAYLDDAPLEERRARAVSMRRVLPESVLSEVGRLDPAAVAQVREEAWPDARDADEVEDALQTLIVLPESFVAPDGRAVNDAWAACFEHLVTERRAARLMHDGHAFWVAASKAKTACGLYPGVHFANDCVEIEEKSPSSEEALLAAVRGWTAHRGPVTANGLAGLLRLPADGIQAALLRLEAEGNVLRGSFTGAAEMEWCDRRLLARIHRLTLGALRKEIEPVAPAQFMRWLLGWQHLAAGTQVAGERGLLEVIGQLQGFEAAANAWEPQILARRVAGYDAKALDQLCLTGAVGWGRFSPHPATIAAADGEASLEPSGLPSAHRRVLPTSVCPITFFVREDSEWLCRRRAPEAVEDVALSTGARRALDFLKTHGASFFPDIVRGTGRLKSEVENELWELVTAGLLTADGFDNLRALIDPKRRAGQGRGRDHRPRHSTGRWSLLFSGSLAEPSQPVEAVARLLLRRYGVVFRELLGREPYWPKWRELLVTLRRFEDRGEVRGGRFVDGFIGVQFALPLAVESLRVSRKSQPAGEIVTISPADPLNLVGIILPGERIPSTSGRLIRYREGVPTEEMPKLASVGLHF
ncbi:MAG: DEAD/DEAH box helicase [Terriglobia bacterium]